MEQGNFISVSRKPESTLGWKNMNILKKTSKQGTGSKRYIMKIFKEVKVVSKHQRTRGRFEKRIF